MEKISINKIAKLAEVSKTTVSFVINNKAEENKIKKETRDRILAIAKKFNYNPNPIAKSLKEGKTFTIGYVTPDISNPFFSKIGRKIEDLMSSHGYQVLFGSTDENPVKEEKVVSNLVNRKIDGLILASCNPSNELISQLVQNDFPLVLFDRANDKLNVNSIMVENRQAMKTLVNSVINKGCSKIGLISITPGILPLKLRIEGYKDALIDHNIKLDEDLVKTVDYKNIREDTGIKLQELFNQDIDALVFTNNLVATESFWHINKYYPSHLRHLQFAAFDNIDLYDFIIPKVTSMAQPITEICEEAVKLLFKIIQDKNIHKRYVLLKPEIIKRN